MANTGPKLRKTSLLSLAAAVFLEGKVCAVYVGSRCIVRNVYDGHVNKLTMTIWEDRS